MNDAASKNPQFPNRSVVQPPLPPPYPPSTSSSNATPYLFPTSAVVLPPICRYINSIQGCRNGQACSFLHPPQNPVMGAEINPNNHPNTKKGPCRFFASSNGCRNGEKCSYQHEIPKSTTSKSSSTMYLPKIEPVLTRHLNSPLIAIDVECVAIGYGPSDRAVARIAVVDESENILYDQFIRPDLPIVSYLTPLTGIVEKDMEGACDLKSALIELRKVIPCNCTIVGQSISKDMQWLGLQQEQDFHQLFDIAHLFRVAKRSLTPLDPPRFRYFSLKHVTKLLLEEDIQEGTHDPVIDALYSMRLFLKYRHLHESEAHLSAVQQTLVSCPQTVSFSERYPFIDGVATSATSHHENSSLSRD